ncbi:hypothetical protein WJX84_008043 [Apatococcus fuscideae]|uniref:Uncharacterized protein n=1 Tax=Apatococcus fuscideae TaxID=2026836 RepID=A0AAW1SPV8_9CHLO
MAQPFWRPESPDAWELEALSLLLFPGEENFARSQQQPEGGTARPPGAAKSAHSAHSPCPSDRQLSSGRHAARSSANMGPPADLSLPPSILNNGSPHLSSADIISTPESAASFGQVMSLERPAMLLNIPRETGSVSGAKILEPGMHGFLEEQGPGKYGRRAAAHVRTGRWQKRPSGTGASAPDSKACQLHPDHSLRASQLSSLREREVRAAVASLQQSQGDSSSSSIDGLKTLQHLHDLMRLPGNAQTAQADKLRFQSHQGMLVQPGWDAVVPSKFTVKQIHCALDTGSLDQPVDLPGLGQGAQTSLQDLTAIPLDQQGSLLANIGQRVVNARCFIKEWGDGPHQAMLRFAGTVGLLGAVFFTPKGSFHFHGKDLLDSPSRTETRLDDFTQMKKALQPDAGQIAMAHSVQQQAFIELGRLQAEQARIVSRTQLNDVWHGPASYGASCTATLLEQVGYPQSQQNVHSLDMMASGAAAGAELSKDWRNNTGVRVALNLCAT